MDCYILGNVNRHDCINRCHQHTTIGKNARNSVEMMVWLLRKCAKCEKYTLNQERCPHCGGNVHIPHPAKFSPEDKYAKYRRAMRGSA